LTTFNFKRYLVYLTNFNSLLIALKNKKCKFKLRENYKKVFKQFKKQLYELGVRFNQEFNNLKVLTENYLKLFCILDEIFINLLENNYYFSVHEESEDFEIIAFLTNYR